MKKEKLEMGETGNFSPLFLNYIKGDNKLSKYYNHYPSLENFAAQIKSKDFKDESRMVLHQVIEKQYQSLEKSDPLKKNIALLKEKNAYTITTGHQLNIFTGPLYFIYKIITVINICQKLKEKYPDKHFVPVYWMASEDHDFEEICHFNLFNKKYNWESDQKGAVGRFDPSSIKQIIEALPEQIDLFENAYLKSSTLANATRHFVNTLFGNDGLVVLDADNQDLKKLFINVIKDDILYGKAGELAKSTSQELEDLGYKTQIYPRDINFFYLDKQCRERIVKKDDHYEVLNTTLNFSKKELADLIDRAPEKFSPNVVMRPLYQEMILPNLAYIGGPAEMAYWLQLGKLFKHYEMPLPILMPRSFALIISKSMERKRQKLQLSVKDLFLNSHLLKDKFIIDHSDNTLNLNREEEVINEVFESVKTQAIAIDKSLEGFIGAEASKVLKGLENIKKRLKKAEENKQETSIKALIGLKDKLFPNGGLQERHDNFLNFFLNNSDLLNQLKDLLDPFDYQFNVLIEDE